MDFHPIPGAPYKYDYLAILRDIHAGKLPRLETYRKLCLDDLFFLLFFGLGRHDVNHPWLVARVREVEADHDGTLDLWAREHYKSTILTYALPIQELLRNPEERIAIFSHTRPIAKGFLRQIKHTLEGDCILKEWFPDVLWANPRKEAPKWSEDDGLLVKRRSKAKEASIEAWGLVDGQPTSKHFTVRIYDDVVTRESVTTPEMMAKTKQAYELSQSLGTDGGRKRVVGTRYHFADLYADLIESGAYKVREHPATDDGTPSGDPVFLSRDRLNELRRTQGPYVFSCQQLLNPVAGEEQTFRPEWIRYYGELPETMDTYIIVDPANSKKASADYTTIVALGIDPMTNRLLLDMVRDRLDLRERWEALAEMWRRWGPCRVVAYEQYGMQADIAYIQEKQQQTGLYFHIEPIGGRTAKVDRILRLVPVFSEYRFLLPRAIHYKGRNLVSELINEEYLTFPFSAHDDMLDAISRIEDPQLAPYIRQRRPNLDKYAHRKNRPMKVHSAAWMGV